MIPYFCFDKIIFGPVTLYTWGIFLGLSILLTYYLIFRQGKKEKIDIRFLDNLLLWSLLGIFIGSRLGYVLQFPAEYLHHPVEIFKITQGGLTFYGGFIGATVAIFIYFKLAKAKSFLIWKTLDLICLYLPTGVAVGRLGCFLINDHQGKTTTLPWGVIWPDGSIRHPVALYLIINALIIFLILNYLKSKLTTSGQLLLAFLFLFSFSRFLLDFTRLSDPAYLGLTISQWISLAILLPTFVIILNKFLRIHPPSYFKKRIKK